MFRTLATIVLLAALSPTIAADDAFHRETGSYRVYLGVVPASLIKKNPTLVDNDKQLHGSPSVRAQNEQHVMVTIFRKSGGARVLNATAIAEVRPKKLFGGRGAEKPLEKMITSGAVAYGNYFDIPERGKYRIDIRIYEPGKDGNEKVGFVYQIY